MISGRCQKRDDGHVRDGDGSDAKLARILMSNVRPNRAFLRRKRALSPARVRNSTPSFTSLNPIFYSVAHQKL
jgi:hypothetical protein